MTLGEIIKNYRAEHSMSMDTFAELSGMSKPYISILEKNRHPKTGKPVIPSITMISKAAVGMGLSFDDLFSMIDGDVRIDPEPISIASRAPSLSPEELDIIGAYRDLSDEGKDMVCGMLHVKRDGAGQEGQNMNAG